MREKVGAFSTPARRGCIPLTLCCPGTGLQQPSARVVSASFTLWPWLTRADRPGPSALGGSCPVRAGAGVLSAGVQAGGSTTPPRHYLSTS